ncbi:ATP-binding protein [uncultured Pseudomonas sp.]|uniref:two-component system sensor histidine kinase NtrB n=1 Tax=uncultured Pseudomonas sp. TaxID=114707 RepID=UPI0025FCCEDB|nr:ATP-binding protein [uncultured Pseudomonas sp.]
MSVEPLSLNSPLAQRILRLYHLYRLIIGIMLVLLVSSDMDVELLDMSNPGLFRAGCWIYLVTNILVVVLLERPQHKALMFSLALSDAILLSGLFYAGGGTASGIGNLLIASVAISNILLRGRVGLSIAAVSAIGIIYLTFYLSFDNPKVANDYVQAGSLGALCFAVALLMQALTARLRLSEVLAEQRAVDVDNLEELNGLILQRMRTGILVLDANRRILLINQAAHALLGHERLNGEVLDDYCPALVERLRHWRMNPVRITESLRTSPAGPVLQASFATLNRHDQQQTLVFLEDLSQVALQAQQLKLAALGRLTAGIAHEIRNPLGAIGHAVQLLEESEELSTPDRRLAQIIHDQSRRINVVIENVLQLSRRREAAPQQLNLAAWLEDFVSQWRASAPPRHQLHCEIGDGALSTRMDPEHLTQVLTNLVHNGLRHSGQVHEQAQVWLRLYHQPDSHLPVLDVLDDGAGVSEQHLGKMFEPFFTTETKGTGLGLYLSRELCASNQAHLDYALRPEGGSCLRITFAHPFKLS